MDISRVITYTLLAFLIWFSWTFFSTLDYVGNVLQTSDEALRIIQERADAITCYVNVCEIRNADNGTIKNPYVDITGYEIYMFNLRPFDIVIFFSRITY